MLARRPGRPRGVFVLAMVALLVACSLGAKVPILFVPTMHETMMTHPLYGTYVKKLESWGTEFMSGFDEGRLKMPAPEKLAQRAIEMLS